VETRPVVTTLVAPVTTVVAVETRPVVTTLVAPVTTVVAVETRPVVTTPVAPVPTVVASVERAALAAVVTALVAATVVMTVVTTVGRTVLIARGAPLAAPDVGSPGRRRTRGLGTGERTGLGSALASVRLLGRGGLLLGGPAGLLGRAGGGVLGHCVFNSLTRCRLRLEP
ncbi:MAG: hypothetical protein HOQ18_06925, partial [Dermatophilaceae bacterium]|nr:hypothetical protein [Dermatophilaceae bacterium]